MMQKNGFFVITLLAITHQMVISQILVESKGEETSSTTTSTTTTTTAGDEYDYDYGCSEEDFECGDGTCINEGQLCDGIQDCDNGGDELDCGNVTISCAENEFDCDGDFCISNDKVCDGVMHCSNNKDEENCPNGNPTDTTTSTTTTTTEEGVDEYGSYEYDECYDGEYKCDDELCINKTQLCDGILDCLAGEDELDCAETSTSQKSESRRVATTIPAICADQQFRCSNGKCIDSSLACDNKDDCGDNSEEENCPASTSTLIFKILSTTRPTAGQKSSGCTYKGTWYALGSEIVSGNCSGITCAMTGRVRKWKDPTCAGCISAKINSALLMLMAAICMLANRR